MLSDIQQSERQMLLNNSVKMPSLNFSTELLDNNEAKQKIKKALQEGWRGIDTASEYHN